MGPRQRVRANRFASFFLFGVLLGLLASITPRRKRSWSRRHREPDIETKTFQETTTTTRTYRRPGQRRISQPI